MELTTLTCMVTGIQITFSLELPVLVWEPNDDGGDMTWECYQAYHAAIAEEARRLRVPCWEAVVNRIPCGYWSSEK